MNIITPLARVGSALTLASALLLPIIVCAAQPDFKGVADKIVGQSANVKEGDRVVVRGDLRDFDLIEEIALAVFKRGGEAIQIVNREKTALRYFDETPAKYDSRPLDLSLKLLEVQTVEIGIDGREFPGLFSNVPADRFLATGKRFADLYAASIKQNVRTVMLGNGLYPTEAIAKSFGLTKDQLSEIFWSGINIDYAKLQANAAKLQSVLANGKELRITHPNGTDLRLRIAGRPVFVSDGVISPEDVSQGGPAVKVYLPAGEVFVTPVPGSAEGRLVLEWVPFEGGVIEGAGFTFKNGKLTAHNAKSNAAYTRWKALYEAAPAGKEELGFVDIGINPNVKVPPGSKLATWVSSGTVTLGTGDNTWAGGTNSVLMNAGGSLNGSTVTLDGKILLERGEFK